jgi:hypothetical protein
MLIPRAVHMKSLRIAFFASCIVGTAPVAADDRPQSIMFDDGKDLDHLTTRPAPKTEQKDRCAELARQVEALKGRPQQRFTAAKRFEAECQR